MENEKSSGIKECDGTSTAALDQPEVDLNSVIQLCTEKFSKQSSTINEIGASLLRLVEDLRSHKQQPYNEDVIVHIMGQSMRLFSSKLEQMSRTMIENSEQKFLVKLKEVTRALEEEKMKVTVLTAKLESQLGCIKEKLGQSHARLTPRPDKHHAILQLADLSHSISTLMTNSEPSDRKLNLFVVGLHEKRVNETVLLEIFNSRMGAMIDKDDIAEIRGIGHNKSGKYVTKVTFQNMSAGQRVYRRRVSLVSTKGIWINEYLDISI